MTVLPRASSTITIGIASMLPWLLVLLAGCAGEYMRDADPGGPPEPDVAKVIFYRPSGIGFATDFPVYDGERLVGFSEAGNYFEVCCAPGKHLFMSGYHLDPPESVDADLAGGKTYYVKVSPRDPAFAPVWTIVGGLAPVTRDDKEWSRVEGRISRMQCRELVPEMALEYGKSDPIGAVRSRLEAARHKAAILEKQDGR